MLSFTWYDLAMGGILVSFVFYEMRQVLTRGMVEAAAAPVALFLAAFWAEPLARMLPQGVPAGVNAALCFMLLFAFLLIAGMAAGRFIYRTGLEMARSWIDPLWGVVFGLVITAIVGY